MTGKPPTPDHINLAGPEIPEKSLNTNIKTDQDQNLIREKIFDELTRVFCKHDQATRLAISAGFPRSQLPDFSTPLSFWAKVVEEANNGVLRDGLRLLATRAADLYPNNRIFAKYSRDEIHRRSPQETWREARQPTGDHPCELRVGVTVEERYYISRIIQTTPRSTVYECQDIRLQRPLILTTLELKDTSTKSKSSEHIERKLFATSAIFHHGLVSTLDFGRLSPNTLYYTTESVQGRPLAQVLCEAGPMLWSRAGRIIVHLIRALKVLHATGLVHRNLNLNNCIILDGSSGNEPDQLKILGIINHQDCVAEIPKSGKSRTYASELQLTSQYIDPYPDIHAAGKILYSLLTNEIPNQSPGSARSIRAIQERAYSDPTEGYRKSLLRSRTSSCEQCRKGPANVFTHSQNSSPLSRLCLSSKRIRTGRVSDIQVIRSARRAGGKDGQPCSHTPSS